MSDPATSDLSAAGNDRPVRIGMLVGSVGEQGGGVPASVRDMASALSRLPNVEVVAFASAGSVEALEIASWRPVGLRVFPIFGPTTFGYARGLDRALSQSGIDVLHVHGLWMYISIAARSWSRRTGRRYLVSPHGMLDSWALANSGWKKELALRAYERRHLDGAACIHALCESERQAVRSFGLCNPICVIPNGVALPPDDFVAHRRSGERRTLLFLGRVTPKKGLVALIEGWSQSRRHPGAGAWDLEIAGSGEPAFVAELEALIDRLGVRSSARLVGHRSGEAKTRAFTNADAFVLPSVSEGQPLAVLEAWAHGLPALITPRCNLPEGFAARAALPIGWSADEISSGLATLFAMPDRERAEMGRRGRALAEQSFSWRSAAERWARVYRWAAGPSTTPSTPLVTR
ncbi:glycosyltransferase [Chenggangzhangella methanolivorans]|uniref:Glycosyltransferase n=1 Tax=Chenggangzhangella methanolivorans TaxID=1437009 RepID=A0A9E6RAN2_9HYPH|nr:glycosyltransferase [Chenggangzhangella methanolivorans]QZO01283.1 glycosyltransferase [Chenggangzhangella methanolivorans]